jgi:hypothetical protein
VPIYTVVTAVPAKLTAGKAVRLVKAASRTQALKYVAATAIEVALPTQEQLVVLVGSGVRVESAIDLGNGSLGTLHR